IPSQVGIYQELIAQEAKFKSTNTPWSVTAVFLDEGINIQDAQQKLLATVKEHEKFPCDTLVKEISSQWSKLQLQIMKWCTNQLILVPNIGDLILSEESCEIETKRLFLPSDMDTVIRQEVGAIKLGIKEGKLHQGTAFDSLLATQNAVKTIKLLQDHKAKNCRGQVDNTCSGKQIADVEAHCDIHIQAYNAH
ncbi:hypothetical protein L208DRAFT_1305694, partial [Tricholoma matsutake]